MDVSVTDLCLLIKSIVLIIIIYYIDKYGINNSTVGSICIDCQKLNDDTGGKGVVFVSIIM